MRADEYLYCAVQQTVEDFLPALAFDDSCQQRHADVHTFQEVHDSRQVLLCQDFGRCHDACLIAVVQCDEHGHQCHKGLARAYVALQQAVHLSAATHVFADFADDAFLCFRQRKGQVFLIECVKVVADLRKDIPTVFAALVAGIAQDVQLHIEQFFELQSQTGTLQLFGILWIVNFAQRVVATCQVQLLRDEVGQRLVKGLFQHVEQCLHESLDGTGVQSRLLHLLRRVIVRLHAHGRELQLVGGIHIGMRHVDATVIDVRSSEDDILLADGVVLLGILAAVKPREVHHLAGVVGKVSHDALLAGTHLEGLETEDMSFHLYERHVARQFADAVEAAAVNVLIGIILQQVAIAADAQLLVEQLLARRANPREVLYVLLQDIVHDNNTSAILRS